MQFEKTEWYIFIIAALVLSLIYYVAFDKNITTVSSAGTNFFRAIMGQNAAGNFQKPF